VSAQMKEKLHEEFFAACATDEETKEVIGRIWKQHHYLLDPHTAVAWKAMEDFQAACPQQGKTVVLSTASPYKFPDSVLSALSLPCEGDSFELIDRLKAETDVPLPVRFVGLREKQERHKDVIAKDEMRGYVVSKAREDVW